MNVFFRVDSSFSIGGGHLIRCLTLAEKLNKYGAKIHFISRKHRGNLNKLVSKKGFKIFELDRNSNIIDHHFNENTKNWLGSTQENDANETIKIIRKEKADLLIVDHYSINYEWEEKLKSEVKKIMIIDDLGNRKHCCDILLDQNWFENMNTRYNNLVSKSCLKLVGPKYALLRKEFSNLKNKNLKSRDNKINRVFVFFGFTDPYNLIGKTLDALSVPEFSHLEVDAVIGGNNSNLEKLTKSIRNLKNICLHIQIDNIAEIMNQADFAIASGGVNTWERMCLNLFSMVIITAENQRETIENLDRNNYVKLIGDMKTIKRQVIVQNIKELIKNNYQMNLNQLSVDGFGTDRVCSYLI